MGTDPIRGTDGKSSRHFTLIDMDTKNICLYIPCFCYKLFTINKTTINLLSWNYYYRTTLLLYQIRQYKIVTKRLPSSKPGKEDKNTDYNSFIIMFWTFIHFLTDVQESYSVTS